MNSEDADKSLKQLQELAKVKANRELRAKAAFASKVRLMTEEIDVLKEIAKLLFSIDQKLK